MFDNWRGFTQEKLSEEWKTKLVEMGKIARGDILKMTTLASSGHPGGSMSSIDIYLTLYNLANVDPNKPKRDDRDRIIISHGHTSPGAYSALASAGFIDIKTAIAGFRQGGSPFEGHVEQSVPGIEWDTGNLGQGLSVGIGKEIYARLSGQDFHTYVFMGDGEQQKGQISESRRIASKFKMNRITAIIDYNRLQISGDITEIMPQNIAQEWKINGWDVIEIDGHNLDEIYSAFYRAKNNSDKPTMIFANTIMGKGFSEIENDHNFHGAAVPADKLPTAFAELGNIENNVDELKTLRSQGPPPPYKIEKVAYPKVETGEPVTYDSDKLTDNRSGFGTALVSVADANMSRDDFHMAVFDCDLAGSVKTAGFAKKYPNNFYQMGISEHSTATASGSLSAEYAISVWADFGVFGIVETYNQARLNDINHSNLKLFCTHCGVNVGEDGKTHQCIDYFALLNSTYGWKVITPADPNQTDRITRYVLSTPGNFAVIMGRAKMPIITNEDGTPYFGGDYNYRYGRMEKIRTGKDLTLAVSGNMLAYGWKAWEALKEAGIEISLVSISDWSDIRADDLKMLSENEHLIILEDHNIKTGLGTTIGSMLFENDLSVKLTKMGVTEYGSSGKPDELLKILGIDSQAVVAKVKELLGR